MIITVPERGSVRLSAAEWEAVSDQAAFWRLVEANVVQSEADGASRWRLKGTCYVGRAIIGGTVLEIVEKFAHSFETLINLGDFPPPKITKTPSPVAKTPGSTAILVSLFVRAVRAYLGGFKRVAYTSVPDIGVIAGGRLDIGRTMRLRAKGRAHQIAFDRSVITADLPINRCIYAALREVERLSRIVTVAPADVMAARALRVALAECLPAVLSSKKGELEQAAATEAAAPNARDEVATAVSIAGALLNAAGFGGAHSWQRVVNRSWFINLESLFEGAVRRALKTCVGTTFVVDSAKRRPSLFPGKANRYRANPDIVIRGRMGPVVAICDAKYKDFTEWPAAADVHELLAHAAGYAARKALLFYPSDGAFSVRSFGEAVTGCEVWAFGIDFNNFISDVRVSLGVAGILAPEIE